MSHGRAAARPRALLVTLAVLILATAFFIAIVAPSSPRADDHSAKARGTRALKAQGYTQIKVSCRKGKRRARCHWAGSHAAERCTGVLTAGDKPVKGRRVRVGTAKCTPTNVDPAKVKGMQYGFNAFTDDASVKLQNKTGATVRRLNVSWSQVQAVPGLYDWSLYDKQYKAMEDGGLKPLVMLFAAPCWSRPSTGCDPLATGPPDPPYDAQWREFVRRATERYPDAIGVEIWSEENLDPTWTPKADPVRYTALLKEAYAAVKAVDPAMPVIAGGLVASAEEARGPVGEGDKPFLAAMYAAGAGDAMDAVGTHPYPYGVDAAGHQKWDPAAMAATVDRLRGVRDANGGKQTIWITEIGEPTTTQPGFPPAASPDQQAADLHTMLQTAIAAPDVPVVIIHTLQDAPANLPEDALGAVITPLTGVTTSYNRINSGFGLFDAKGNAKPAACTLSRQLGGPLPCP